MPNVKTTTPEEYIAQSYNKLQREYGKRNVQVNKLGYIGFLLNLLGHTQFDIKQYYDYLFKEGFVATAEEEHNLYMHSYIYGFNPTLAVPATAHGDFSFDFSFVSNPSNNVIKREVIFQNISFFISDFEFQTDYTYKFVEDKNSYYTSIYKTSTGEKEIISSPSKNIKAPFRNIIQKSMYEEEVDVPLYKYGAHYSHSPSIGDNGYISDIKVWIRRSGVSYEDDEWESFDVKMIKFLEDAFTPVVFMKMLSATDILIETGSGLHGDYIPGSRMKINLDMTSGEFGNMNTTKSVKLNDKSRCYMKTYFDDGREVVDVADNLKRLLNVNFEYSSQGQTPPTGDELSREIIEYIQTRDNLLTEKDYYNVTNDRYDDFVFFFKKSEITENIFFLYKTFRDRYMNPVHTDTKTIRAINPLDEVENIQTSIIDASASQLPYGSYTYSIIPSDQLSTGAVASTGQIDVSNDYQGVEITWDPVDYATNYIVLKYDENQNEYYQITESTSIVDTGDFHSATTFVKNYNTVFYPEFEIDETTFICPFVFEFNKIMNWYTGYVFYDNFIVYPNKITYNTEVYDLPLIYFNIVFNYQTRTTSIKIKSHQAIETYSFKLTIHGLNIINEVPSLVGDNAFIYVHDEQNGYIKDEFYFELNVYDEQGNYLATLQTANTRQMYPIEDQLKINRFVVRNDENYLVNIPLIEKNKYLEDKYYYLDKILESFYNSQIYRNRLPADDVQMRFLSTYYIQKYYLSKILKQNYNFDLKLPLNLKVECKIDMHYLNNNDIDLAARKEELYDELASQLQSEYSGCLIKYYNSQLIDFVHSGRPYIKQVIVTVTDSNDNVINEGIESRDHREAVQLIQDDFELTAIERKINILRFTPPLFHWDLDNIELYFLYE